MVAVSLLPHAEFGPNGHREDASHYIIVNSATKTKNNTLCTRLGTRFGTTLSTTLDATIYTTLSPYINGDLLNILAGKCQTRNGRKK